MLQALILNAMIIGTVIVGLVYLKNPLALIALTFLRELPHGVPTADQLIAMQQNAQGVQDVADDDARPIGFTANVC